MRIGIDASNVRAGGTVTHLIELLRAATPGRYGIDEVIVWSNRATLDSLEDRPWLRKAADSRLRQAANPFADRRQLHRAFWQRFSLANLARKAGCDLLFVPGGTDTSGFRPLVAMSQNMLPFDRAEASRYGLSLARFRLLMLRRLYIRTFRRADGVILLTDYARTIVLRSITLDATKCKVIPHGISDGFSCAPRVQRPIQDYSPLDPFRILYVSTVDLYKHQWHVAEAVALLRQAGLPVALDLVGPSYREGLRRLESKLAELDPSADFITYRGVLPYEELAAVYRQADLKVFASSCENMPIILLEAMSSGLPVACSLKGPMAEVLGDAGVYFDPEKPEEIRTAIESLIHSPRLRAEKAAGGFERARQYSWERCADETFSFLAQCARRNLGRD